LNFLLAPWTLCVANSLYLCAFLNNIQIIYA
jgi:hypothetical protein